MKYLMMFCLAIALTFTAATATARQVFDCATCSPMCIPIENPAGTPATIYVCGAACSEVFSTSMRRCEMWADAHCPAGWDYPADNGLCCRYNGTCGPQPTYTAHCRSQVGYEGQLCIEPPPTLALDALHQVAGVSRWRLDALRARSGEVQARPDYVPVELKRVTVYPKESAWFVDAMGQELAAEGEYWDGFDKYAFTYDVSTGRLTVTAPNGRQTTWEGVR